MGVPTLAYLGDVDKAREVLINKTLLTRTQFYRVDTEYYGDGFKDVVVDKNKPVTVKAIGVGTRAFPVKIIVEDENGVQFYQNVAMSKTNCGMRDDEFSVDNEKYLFDHKGMFNQSFMDYYQYVGGIMGSSGNAGKCNGCGKCLRKCPQKLDIIEELKKVKKEFEIPGYKFVLVFVQKVGFPIYRFMVKLLNR
jgi:ferredoxin